MQRIDLLIAGSLVLAAAGSAVGLLAYDDTRRASTFEITWALSSTAVVGAPESHTAGGAHEVRLPVRLRNLTSVDLTVMITAAGPRLQGGRVDVEVRAPGYGPVTASGQLTAGPGVQTIEVPVRVELGDAPDERTVAARSPDAALARLNGTHGTGRGAGVWTITVTFPPGVVVDREAHTIEVAGQARTFRAIVTLEAPATNR